MKAKKVIIALAIFLSVSLPVFSRGIELPFRLRTDLSLEEFFSWGCARKRIDDETFIAIFPSFFELDEFEKETTLYLSPATDPSGWFKARITSAERLGEAERDEWYDELVAVMTDILGSPMEKEEADRTAGSFITPMTPKEKVMAFKAKNPALVLLNKYIGARLKPQYDFDRPEDHELWKTEDMLVLVHKLEDRAEIVVYNIWKIMEDGNAEVEVQQHLGC